MIGYTGRHIIDDMRKPLVILLLLSGMGAGVFYLESTRRPPPAPPIPISTPNSDLNNGRFASLRLALANTPTLRPTDPPPAPILLPTDTPQAPAIVAEATLPPPTLSPIPTSEPPTVTPLPPAPVIVAEPTAVPPTAVVENVVPPPAAPTVNIVDPTPIPQAAGDVTTLVVLDNENGRQIITAVVREGPSTAYRAVDLLYPETIVSVLGRVGSGAFTWYFVETPSGKQGWISVQVATPQ